MKKENAVFVAGHNGMVGRAITRRLSELGQGDRILTKTRSELDLTCQKSVLKFFNENKVDEVYLAAAKVGGIHANNTYPGQFIFENLMVQCNVINAAYKSGVEKLLFLGSSCIYPKYAEQPIEESQLMLGPLEATNEPYGIAKIAGIKLCESYNRQYGTDYRSVMPTNLYGPFDNFHPENSHVLPALLRRFHEAVVNREEQVVIWGSGKPRREFLHVDDMAIACIHVMGLSKKCYQQRTDDRLSHLNIGSGKDISIREIAEIIAEVTGFRGELVFDSSKPDGTPRKLLNVEKIHSLGWNSSLGLRKGIEQTYKWYCENNEQGTR